MKKILVIRRDNIGDLVCTTPMIGILRKRYPDAWIGVLANRYNVAALDGNPDVDETFDYRKAKHRAPGEFRLAIWLETAGLMWRLRRMKIDVAIVASPGGERYAHLINAKQIISEKPARELHEVERCVDMLKPLGISDLPENLEVRADPQLVALLTKQAGLEKTSGSRWAVHISARRPKQRWPAANFVSLIGKLLADDSAAQILLFWSPGSQDDPAHPGDDEKIAEILKDIADPRIVPIRTSTLGELVAGLSLCDAMICSDGGAMHLAAGLGKPIVCMFGDSDVSRWHPWRVPHEVVRPESGKVCDVTPEELIAAINRLRSGPDRG